jgi:hypothetical protein
MEEGIQVSLMMYVRMNSTRCRAAAGITLQVDFNYAQQHLGNKLQALIHA